MSRQEKSAYDKHVEDIMVQNDILDTAKMEGRAEGRAEGLKEALKEGIEQGRLETAKALHQMGLSNEQIAQATKLSIEKLKELFI